MTFGQPFFLAFLALVPVMGLFLVWAMRRRQRDILRLGEPGLVQRLSTSVNWRGRKLRNALWIFSLGLLVLALARPQWGSEAQAVEQQGVQVMVALDVSNSMLAEDLRPNRLLRAKLEISDLMDKLDGDEIGLVLFSGASFVQFPLTSDYSTARQFLDGASTNSISRQGTAIADAIHTALGGFDMDSAAQKVIVVVTDGEDHEGDAMAAARAAADAGVLIYTLGFGSPEGVPIPEYDPYGQLVGYKVDQAGQTVLSRLNETTLQEIAAAAGGAYFRATDGSELDALVAELDKLQAGQIESRTAVTQTERFQIFLIPALVALMLMELIPDRARVRRTISQTNVLGRPRRRRPALPGVLGRAIRSARTSGA